MLPRIICSVSVTSKRTLTITVCKLRSSRRSTLPLEWIVRPKSTFSEREYLHRSIVPTYHFQASLPRLPVPKLELTAERYLRAQHPLLSHVEYSKTAGIAMNFIKNEGLEFHKELVDTDKKSPHTSYISEPWFNMYLSARVPIVLNYNPFITFCDDPRPEYNSQLIKTANMLLSSIRFMKTLRDGYLEPEIFHLNPKKSDTTLFRRVMRLTPEKIAFYGAFLFKAFPLDMSQYKCLFNSTRIPKKSRDEIVTDPTARHIVVMKNGHFYVFDVLDEDGNIISGEEVLAHLKYIYNDKSRQPEHPVSLLTSENRDTWAMAREELCNAGNLDALRIIDRAAFVIALDGTTSTDPDNISKNFLYGDGINRWFDKSFTLIVTGAGTAGVNFEHAWGDGVAVLRYFKEVFADSTKKPQVSPQTAPANVDSSHAVRRLEFRLNEKLEAMIGKARENFVELTSPLSLSHLQYHVFNKKFVKKNKLSPDSIMQLAIQMAYYRMHGKTVGTYESCSTAAFKHGRTETVRPCTGDTLAVCRMLYGPNPSTSVEELQKALQKCSATHNKLVKEAAMGQGFDRHLFALRTIATKYGKHPDIFTDPNYAFINHIILSTSTLSDPAVVIGGFAPVVPDGFGIGYSIEDNRIGFNVTSYPANNVDDFVESCRMSLDDIYSILNGKLPARKS